MCGIAGIWAIGAAGDGPTVLRAMTDALAHRGPDGAGWWSDPTSDLHVGHRRLSIVGLGPSGDQPMQSRDERFVVTYNGEIYNAPELAERLAGEGIRLRGRSDTEVLVEAIAAWGLQATLARLDGMFAFACWDRRDRVLTLARDRMGEKPLAYAPVGAGMAFASELGALRRVPGFDSSIDPDAVALFLRFKYVPAPWTIHPGARKLPPGHTVEVRDGRVGTPVAFWTLAETIETSQQTAASDDELLDRLDTVLAGAVARRLRADVGVGAFLSGGVDSTLVTTLAAEASRQPLHTFTMGSEDRDHDESGPAREIASRLGTHHHELVVTGADALAAIPSLAGTWDEPFADSSQLPTLLVSELARQTVTVALSGDGGDELFGGYNRHLWLPRTWGRIGGVPATLRRGAAAALSRPLPSTWDRISSVLPEGRRPRLLGVKAEKFASVLGASDAAAAYGRLVSHWQDPDRVAVGASEPATLTHRPGDWPHAASLAETIMAVDALTYLPDDVLVKVDRASMAHGLEARVPLIAPDVVAEAIALPLDMKIRDGKGKWALRELLARRHPRSLLDRPKSGFGVPIDDWLRGPLRPWAEELLRPARLRADGLVRPEPVNAAWTDHVSGRRDRSYELWDVLMLTSWFDGLR